MTEYKIINFKLSTKGKKWLLDRKQINKENLRVSIMYKR